MDPADTGLSCPMLSCNLLSSASSSGLVGGARCSCHSMGARCVLKGFIGA